MNILLKLLSSRQIWMISSVSLPVDVNGAPFTVIEKSRSKAQA